MSDKITLIECPRDALQGWPHYIPVEKKINYLNLLLQVGFDILDFGSFVSAKAIPQLADTKEVIKGLDLSLTKTQLLAIVANLRGAVEAVAYEQISFLGFPFSISETFQLRNTQKTILESLNEVTAIQKLCETHKKTLVIYISMGFGNPYNDPYNAGIAINWVAQLANLGISTFAISDTVGLATPTVINTVFKPLISQFPLLNIGAHFHSDKKTWEEKINTAFENGCIRFDSALKGIGGCPMANDELVGNIATENLIYWATEKNLTLNINSEKFQEALNLATQIFK